MSATAAPTRAPSASGETAVPALPAGGPEGSVLTTAARTRAPSASGATAVPALLTGGPEGSVLTTAARTCAPGSDVPGAPAPVPGVGG